MEDLLYYAPFISILQIIAIDIVLGGDNAIVIALACKNLPAKQRKLGIIYGALGAIVLRVLMVFFATALLTIPYLKIIGGLLLVWIGVKLILDHKSSRNINIKQEGNLSGAIKTIIIADFVMSLDNSVAIAGVADGNIPIVIFGVLLSIPIIIWGSSLILKYLDKFPSIVFLGALLLGWIGGDMIQTDVSVTDFTSTFDLFVIPLLFAILTVFLPNIRRKL
ncbi:MAG: TerC family protein [Gammaproteobacteria bacterium]|jgi:YjbE family integral membrane protein|nr:TerC family protein [Gammaproteobacteria bacterium]MBT7603325.1 TerC family protein [Gammaproteobacteria bacterium]